MRASRLWFFGASDIGRSHFFEDLTCHFQTLRLLGNEPQGESRPQIELCISSFSPHEGNEGKSEPRMRIHKIGLS
jgi:hypothetical protein